jgi:F420-0:gamma-glutamyl ligase
MAVLGAGLGIQSNKCPSVDDKNCPDNAILLLNQNFRASMARIRIFMKHPG